MVLLLVAVVRDFYFYQQFSHTSTEQKSFKMLLVSHVHQATVCTQAISASYSYSDNTLAYMCSSFE